MHATSPSSEHLRTGDDLFHDRDYLGAREAYRTAFEAARTEFNRSVEVEALSQVARTHIAVGELASARTLLTQVEAISRETDSMGWSRFQSVLGRLAWKEGRLADAHGVFVSLYAYCSEHALPGRAVDAANMLSIVSESLDEQVAWIEKGIAIAETNDETGWLGPLWNNLGGIRFEQEKLAEALEAYLKAREYHWRHSPEGAKLFADYHVGMVYRHMGDYARAAKWLRPVLSWAERLGHDNARGQTLEELGEIAAAQGDTDSARRDLSAALLAYKAAGFEVNSPNTITRVSGRIASLG